MRPPSNDCSASTECGGKRNRSVARRAISAVPAASAILILKRRPARVALCAGGFRGLDDDSDLYVHVRVQVQVDLVLADDPQRAVVQTNLAALDLDAVLTHGFGDVERPNRTEELALGAGLHLDLEHEPLELLGSRLGRGE